MNRNTNVEQEDAGSLGWRYCYECISPGGSRMRVLSEAEAYFWYVLGYQIRRMLERAS